MTTNSIYQGIFGRIYGEGDTPPPPPPPAPPPPPPPAPPPKMFNQEEVNKFLADDRRKTQEKLKSLEEISTKFKLTQEEKDNLAAQMETIKQDFMSKEELAKQEKERIANEYSNNVKKLSGERDQWKSLHDSKLATSEIVAAASDNKAFNAEQIKMLLLPRAKVVPAVDKAGKPTGDYKTVVPMPNKDGEMVDMPVSEAVKTMRSEPTYANLFLADGTGGLGSQTLNVSGGSGEGDTPPTDPAGYRAWRAKKLKKG